MKKTIFLAIVFSIMLVSVSFAATLNLKATWTANAETDMKDYRLYRTDGTRVLLGTIVHPTTTFSFSVTVPDQSSGTLTFVLTARDSNNNESGDSTTSAYPFNLDSTAPASPRNLVIQQGP